MLFQPQAPTGLGSRVLTAIHYRMRDLADRFLDWQHAQKEMTHLRALDDRMLSDMGIARPGIAALFRSHRRPSSVRSRRK